MDLKLIDVTKVRANMEAGIAANEKQLAAVKATIEALKQFEGKDIHGRIVTQLSKLLPQYKFSFGRPHSWFELSVSGEGFKTADLNIGYVGQTKVITNAVIVEQNQRHLLDERRLVQYREELKTVEARAERWNAAVRELKAASENLGDGKHHYVPRTLDTYVCARDENDRLI